MEINAKFLFNLLLRYVKPQMVCDIGSMDGADALRFAKMLPYSKVVIFEANPENFSQISLNSAFKKNSVLIYNEIVWNEDGPRKFFVVKPSLVKGIDEHLKGISSVYYREEIKEQKCIQLKGVRLDTKMLEIGDYDSIALWIDTEGASYEVLEGIEGIREKVKLIHAEVETKEIWDGQKTRLEVLALAERMGYVLLGHGRNTQQHDIVLVDKTMLESSPRIFRFLAFVAHLKGIRIKRIFRSIFK